MNIYDCFMFFDEDLLLDIRLNSLNKYVKKFVISEATYTHNGTKKNLNFNIKNFSKFKDKIVYVPLEKEPSNIMKINDTDTNDERGKKLILNGMARDYYQRENLQKGLTKSNDEDLILISDLDEIPNLKNFEFSKIKNNIIIFEQKMFYYKLNLYYKNFKWFGTKGTKKKNLISPQWVRNIKNKKYPWWRLDVIISKEKYSKILFVEDGGWHFTCIRTPEDLERKMLNFAHHYEFEDSGLKVKDLEKLMKEKKVMYSHNLDKRKNKWSGGANLEKIENFKLPDYIKENLKKFDKWLD